MNIVGDKDGQVSYGGGEQGVQMKNFNFQKTF